MISGIQAQKASQFLERFRSIKFSGRQILQYYQAQVGFFECLSEQRVNVAVVRIKTETDDDRCIALRK